MLFIFVFFIKKSCKSAHTLLQATVFDFSLRLHRSLFCIANYWLPTVRSYSLCTSRPTQRYRSLFGLWSLCNPHADGLNPCVPLF